MPQVAPKDDSWAFQPIGAPFPNHPVKVLGEQNMYVALWYKHGKPIHGRAWNDGGVVQCSFPYINTELTGADKLEGEIQLLQYVGNHLTLGYWYEWIQYKDRFASSDRQLLKCGQSMPILWKDRGEGALLGFLDMHTEVAAFSHDGIAENVVGEKNLANMWIIARNLKGGPPFCECGECPKVPTTPAPRIMLNEWVDLCVGDPFPTKTIKALNRSLDTVPDANPDQYVALWYQHGEPVMGRVWNDGGKIAAAFGWNKNEYLNDIGTVQVLAELPDHARGFDYSWQPFSVAAKFGDKEWHPVHVDSVHGDISPCVIKTPDGKEVLGKVDIRNERASSAYHGKEHVFVGPIVQTFTVLCRKARPGCKFD